MKKTTTKQFIFSVVIATLMVAGLATAGYSDSFVDDQVISALKDFKFGRSGEITVSKAEVKPVFDGDSFVDANVMEAIQNFRFGYNEQYARLAQPETPVFKGDAFVDAEVLKQLDGFVFLKGVPAHTNRIADQEIAISKK